MSDNRPASNQLRLARAPRGGLRGLRPQSFRPPLQAAPSGATPCRVPPCPGQSQARSAGIDTIEISVLTSTKLATCSGLLAYRCANR